MKGGSRKRRHHSKPGPRLDPTRPAQQHVCVFARPKPKAALAEVHPLQCSNANFRRQLAPNAQDHFTTVGFRDAAILVEYLGYFCGGRPMACLPRILIFSTYS
jgi:hypothetical protein